MDEDIKAVLPGFEIDSETAFYVAASDTLQQRKFCSYSVWIPTFSLAFDVHVLNKIVYGNLVIAIMEFPINYFYPQNIKMDPGWSGTGFFRSKQLDQVTEI